MLRKHSFVTQPKGDTMKMPFTTNTLSSELGTVLLGIFFTEINSVNYKHVKSLLIFVFASESTTVHLLICLCCTHGLTLFSPHNVPSTAASSFVEQPFSTRHHSVSHTFCKQKQHVCMPVIRKLSPSIKQ